MKTLKIALDWTPNVNHIGFFVARELGFYKERNLEIQIINPLDDDYQITPGKKLEVGLADFALAPFETVISLNNKENRVDAIAIFALLQEDISRIACLASSKIERPQNLAGKVYSSYKARYEDAIVQQMVKNDGGIGPLKIIYPKKLGIWNTLIEKIADATWIFDNWEGVEAETKNIALNTFSLQEYGIPYGYSPIILTKKSQMEINKEEYSHFIKASRDGFLYSVKNKSEAVQILKPFLKAEDQRNIDLLRSLEITSPYFGNEVECGRMDPSRMHQFLKWLVDNKLENHRILDQILFTNELIH
jgi:ABC-type nitrate/sulfonate/bicarbonate transport system substrate-binding protein